MRRAGAAKREVLPDPKYGSRLVAKFVNIMMIRGKKSTAERIMYVAMTAIEDRSKQEVDNPKDSDGAGEELQRSHDFQEIVDTSFDLGSELRIRDYGHLRIVAH